MCHILATSLGVFWCVLVTQPCRVPFRTAIADLIEQSADVFARFCRARGLQTLYICGSDEFGTATSTKALSEGVDPATLCAKYYAIHKEIYEWFRIDFDVFGRTPTPEHTEIVQGVFAKLWNNSFIEERESTQAFCPVPSHSSFLADRFVEGECSICHDLGARGHQV